MTEASLQSMRLKPRLMHSNCFMYMWLTVKTLSKTFVLEIKTFFRLLLRAYIPNRSMSNSQMDTKIGKNAISHYDSGEFSAIMSLMKVANVAIVKKNILLTRFCLLNKHIPEKTKTSNLCH